LLRPLHECCAANKHNETTKLVSRLLSQTRIARLAHKESKERYLSILHRHRTNPSQHTDT